MSGWQAILIAAGFVGAVLAIGMGSGLIADWWKARKVKRNQPPPPICAETGAPKNPRGCWNVRCQLGETCCRIAGVDLPGGGKTE